MITLKLGVYPRMVVEMEVPYWLLIGVVAGVVAGFWRWLLLRSRSRRDEH